MGGYPCYKMILCGANGLAAVRAVMDIGIERSDDAVLTDAEYKEIVAYLEDVEDRGNALAEKLGGTGVPFHK